MAATGLKKIGLALSAYALGLLATVAAIFLVFRLPGRLADVIGIPLVWPWWLTTKYGTRMLPDSVTAPYDPFGHPLLHVSGIAANGWYLAALFYLVFVLIRRRKTVGKKSTA